MGSHMIIGISHTYVWVENQDRALAFWTEKLGFDVRDDRRMGAVRWTTVGHPEQPQLTLVLAPIGATLDAEAAGHVRGLLAKGAINGGGLLTDDCRATHAALTGKGVEFVQEPEDRPYGIEAIFRDDSGNLWGLVQPRA
jgi:catechol 2,3-dioxygenase-like lactoylglutathione lyase family enzyme